MMTITKITSKATPTIQSLRVGSWYLWFFGFIVFLNFNYTQRNDGINEEIEGSLGIAVVPATYGGEGK